LQEPFARLVLSTQLHTCRYHPMYVHLYKNHNSKLKKKEKKPPLPQIIHRKDEPKTHHLQNSTKVSPKTNPFNIFSRSILYEKTARGSRYSLLFSSIQSIHLYSGKFLDLTMYSSWPIFPKLLTHQINPRTQFAGFSEVTSAINDNTHLSAKRSPHPRKC